MAFPLWCSRCCPFSVVVLSERGSIGPPLAVPAHVGVIAPPERRSIGPYLVILPHVGFLVTPERGSIAPPLLVPPLLSLVREVPLALPSWCLRT